jgi:ATP adenylyltransferase
MEFIKGPKPSGCFLCDAVNAQPSQDAEHYVLARTEHCIALMNIYPYNNGHLLVAPNQHITGIDELAAAVAADLMVLTQRALRVLKSVLNPEGFNLGVNLGKVAGAGLADHVHQHVVPRWGGDTNFMPILSEVKVLNEHLKTSYLEIRAGFDRHP